MNQDQQLVWHMEMATAPHDGSAVLLTNRELQAGGIVVYGRWLEPDGLISGWYIHGMSTTVLQTPEAWAAPTPEQLAGLAAQQAHSHTSH